MGVKIGCRWLSWEQWLIVIAMGAALSAGIHWGLPNKRRMDLLLGGQSLTERQRQLLTTLRESYYEKLDAEEDEAAEKALRGEKVELAPSGEPGGALSEEERLAALRAFLSGSEAIDERKTYSALSRMNPGRLDFDPRMYIYGGSYLYPLGAILYGFKSIGLLHVTDDFSRYLRRPSEIALLYMAGRGLNIAAFLGTLLLLGRLGMTMAGRLSGTGAMLAYSFSTLPLNQCLVSKPHVYAAFWALLSLYLLVCHAERGRLHHLLLSGAAAGWAAGASLPCGALALLFPIVLWDRRDVGGALRKVAMAWAGMGLVFLITNPYALIRFDRYWLTVKAQTSPEGWGHGSISLRKLGGYIRCVFTQAYCFPVSVLGALGLGEALARGRAPARRVAAGTVCLLLAIGLSLDFPRYSIFVGALICLFAGWGLGVLSRCLRGTSGVVQAGALTLMFLPGAFFAGLFVRDVVWDEKWLGPAVAWARSVEVNARSSFGVFGSPNPVNSPPFPFLNARVVNLKKWSGEQAPPDFVILGNYSNDRSLWAAHPLRSQYELAHELGYRPSYDWLLRWRVKSQSRMAGWVYRRRGAADGGGETASQRSSPAQPGP